MYSSINTQQASKYDAIKAVRYGPSHTYAVIVGHMLDSVGQMSFVAGIWCPILTEKVVNVGQQLRLSGTTSSKYGRRVTQATIFRTGCHS